MKILLLAGGDSNERAVSLDSGLAIYEALQRLEHIVYAIDPISGKSLLNSDGTYIEYETDESGRAVVPPRASGWSLAKTLGSPAFNDIDVVFIAMHGGFGENGMLQCLLEIAGKKHTGSEMEASAIAMNKAVSKRLCTTADIKTSKFSLYRLQPEDVTDKIVNEISDTFEFPVIVKPNDGGSTIALSKVCKKEDLKEALKLCADESPNVLIEKFISGREITAAVLDGKPLPLVEIKPKKELYDYEAKYKKGLSEYIVPAEISDELTAKIQSSAKEIYDIIGCAGLARADFILDEHDDFYFLELNTLPGMTELSLAPMAAKSSGLKFEDLIIRMIESAQQ